MVGETVGRSLVDPATGGFALWRWAGMRLTCPLDESADWKRPRCVFSTSQRIGNGISGSLQPSKCAGSAKFELNWGPWAMTPPRNADITFTQHP